MLKHVYTPHLGRDVLLRPGSSDEQVWADTFTGRYHLPPEWAPTPHTVLDVGANIGLVTADYRHHWPDAFIIAAEMNPESADICSRNNEGVPVFVCAVAGSTGVGTFDPDAAYDACSFRSDPEGMTRALRLGELIDAAFSGEVDLVKLDIEGGEWDVLADAAAWAPLVRSLIVEFHPDATHPVSSRALLLAGADALLRRGYQVTTTTHPRGLYAWRPVSSTTP